MAPTPTYLENHRPFALNNSEIGKMKEDVMYHLGLTYSDDDRDQIKNIFGDVKFFITGGSAERMTKVAEMMSEKLKIKSPFGYNLAPIGKTTRYTIYKVGPVLIANHGMGMPSISILLHEVAKLLHHAECEDVVFIRIGTSGGIGCEPGTVVISSEGLNGELRPVHSFHVLGKKVERPAIMDSRIAAELVEVCTKNNIAHAIGKTLSCDDFYEEQGRLDGAICDYTEEEKMAFLKRCDEVGVRNIEMESRGMAAFCHHLNIPCAVVCVTLLNRLDGDQVTSSKEKLMEFEARPINVVLEYIQSKTQSS